MPSCEDHHHGGRGGASTGGWGGVDAAPGIHPHRPQEPCPDVDQGQGKFRQTHILTLEIKLA